MNVRVTSAQQLRGPVSDGPSELLRTTVPLVLTATTLALAAASWLLPITAGRRLAISAVLLGGGLLTVALELARHRWPTAGLVEVVPAIAVAAAVGLLAPGTFEVASLLVLVLAALVTTRSGPWVGAGTVVVAEAVLFAAAVAMAPDGGLPIVQTVAELLVGLVVVLAVGSVQRHAATTERSLRTLDDAVLAFARDADSGELVAAVTAGVRAALPHAEIVSVELGDGGEVGDDLVALLLDTVRSTKEVAVLPEGFKRTADNVLAGIPIPPSTGSAGALVVRLAADAPDEDLVVLRDYLERVSPTLVAGVALSELRASAEARPAAAPVRGNTRDDLVARAAHDLRIPLTSLAGTADTLARHADALNAAQRQELYEALARSTRRVTAWVTALLEDSMQGTEVAGRPHAVPLQQLLAESRESTRAATLGIEVDVLPTDLVVHADPGLVIRALANILSNAGHHAGDGKSIEIISRRAGRFAEISVQDHGPGFPELVGPEGLQDEELDTIGRGEQSRGQGLGLGFGSARRLVASWGGRMGIRPTRGGGATVWFTVPLGDPEDLHRAPTGVEAAGSPEVSQPVGAASLRWSVVDPDPTALGRRIGG